MLAIALRGLFKATTIVQFAYRWFSELKVRSAQ
jgi:hypothetical protein